MTRPLAHRIDRSAAIDRAVRDEGRLAAWSCPSTIVTDQHAAFGPMTMGSTNGVKYGRPRRTWM